MPTGSAENNKNKIAKTILAAHPTLQKELDLFIIAIQQGNDELYLLCVLSIYNMVNTELTKNDIDTYKDDLNAICTEGRDDSGKVQPSINDRRDALCDLLFAYQLSQANVTIPERFHQSATAFTYGLTDTATENDDIAKSLAFCNKAISFTSKDVGDIDANIHLANNILKRVKPLGNGQYKISLPSVENIYWLHKSKRTDGLFNGFFNIRTGCIIHVDSAMKDYENAQNKGASDTECIRHLKQAKYWATKAKSDPWVSVKRHGAIDPLLEDISAKLNSFEQEAVKQTNMQFSFWNSVDKTLTDWRSAETNNPAVSM